MQLWLRPYKQAFLLNVLCNETQLLTKDGLEIHVEFEKGDRLKWINELTQKAFERAVSKSLKISNVLITCSNSELFERNWASHLFGDQLDQDNSIAHLFLNNTANNLGLPLQWLIDEWQTLNTVRAYHQGLLKKYDRLSKQVENQLLYRGGNKLYSRDPILATCTEILVEHGNSDFIHLNSDEEIQPVWMTAVANSQREPFLY